MTREVPLSRGMVALVDDENYEFILAAGPWTCRPDRHRHYAHRYVLNADGVKTTQDMHRLLLDAPMVDHINGDGLDNRRENLRPATHSQNRANARLSRNNTSGYKGVHLLKKRGLYMARIRVNYRSIFLGEFRYPVDAARAYDAAALHHFGPYARINFPNGAAA